VRARGFFGEAIPAVYNQAVAAAPANAGLFPPTRWTLVLAARDRPEERRRALDELLAPRWRALYVLARKGGLPPAEAEDAVQSFVVRLIEGDLLARLDPGRGRLRSYLRTAFAHHLINLHEHASAARRSAPGADLPELEALVASPAASPEALFERTWALGLFEEALATLEGELAAGERRGPVEVLRALFRFDAGEPYPVLAARHGMTVPQLKSFVHRSKSRFRHILRDRVADTLVAGDDVDAEVAALLEALAA
jgi:DNA-directed RNA polymerase specialized sigma24 family protein